MTEEYVLKSNSDESHIDSEFASRICKTENYSNSSGEMIGDMVVGLESLIVQ